MIDGPRLSPASGRAPRSLVVLLHGYGSNGDDLIGLAPLIQPALPDAAFVAPNAPAHIPDLAEGRMWWPIRTFSSEERAAGAAGSASVVDEFLTDELAATGLEEEHLLLVGFSQGTMMALHTGLRRRRRLAGIIGFSGMLVAPDRLAAEIASRPPVMLVHGTADDIVPYSSLDAAKTYLQGVGVEVETHISPGVGHTVDAGGLAAAGNFASRVLSSHS